MGQHTTEKSGAAGWSVAAPRRAVVVVLVACILASACAGPVFAQEGTPTPAPSNGSDDGAAPPTVGVNGTTNESNASEEDGGLFSGISAPSVDVGPDLDQYKPSSVVDSFANMTIDAWAWSLSKAIPLAIGTPVPQNDGWLGVFGEPTGRFQAGYEAILEDILYPLIPQIVAIAIMAVGILLMLGGLRGRYRAGKLVFAVCAGTVVVGFAWTWASFNHALADAITMAIAPSAEELTDSTESLAKSAGGPIAAALGIATVGWGEAIAIAVIYGGRRALLEAGPYGMAFILLVQFFGPHRYVRIIGTVAHLQYLALVYMTVPAAIIFRIAYSLNWAFSPEGAVNVFVTLGLFLGVIIWPFFSSASALLAPFLLGRYGKRGADAMFDRFGGDAGAGGGVEDGGQGHNEGDVHDGPHDDTTVVVKTEDGEDVPPGAEPVGDGTAQMWADPSASSAADIRQDDPPAAATPSTEQDWAERTEMHERRRTTAS